jgi:hypothetical protein
MPPIASSPGLDHPFVLWLVGFPPAMIPGWRRTGRAGKSAIERCGATCQSLRCCMPAVAVAHSDWSSEWATAPSLLSWLLTLPLGVLAQAVQTFAASPVGTVGALLAGTVAVSATAWVQGTALVAAWLGSCVPSTRRGNGAVI